MPRNPGIAPTISPIRAPSSSYSDVTRSSRCVIRKTTTITRQPYNGSASRPSAVSAGASACAMRAGIHRTAQGKRRHERAAAASRNPRRYQVGITALIGIVGAVVGGFLAGVLFDADPLDEFFDISTWLTAIVGAIILLMIYRM